MRIRDGLVMVAGLVLAGCHGPTANNDQRQASVHADAYEVVDLGMLGGPTQAFGINDAGTVIGRHPNGSFRWTRQDGFEELGGINGFPFLVFGQNNRGDLSGWVPTTPINVIGQTYAVLLTRQGDFIRLDDDSHTGRGHGINNRGEVVGVRSPVSGGPQRAFIWRESTGITEIAPPASTCINPRSVANAINTRSEVTGVTNFGLPGQGCAERAFIWDEKRGLRVLPGLGGPRIAATDINAHGVIVGVAETRPPLPGESRTNVPSNNPGDVPNHAWRWSEETGLVDLGTLGGKHSLAWAVDDHGNAYGWAHNAAGDQRAVMWTVSGAIVELGTLGGTQSSTGGVNHRGHVAGQASTPNGEFHAVLFIPRN